MKKVLLVLMALAFVLSMTATPVFADPGEKLQDGLKQFITSPKNIPDSISEEYEAAEFKPFGLFGGTLKGLVMTVYDAGAGLFNTLTFPVDLDSSN